MMQANKKMKQFAQDNIDSDEDNEVCSTTETETIHSHVRDVPHHSTHNDYHGDDDGVEMEDDDDSIDNIEVSLKPEELTVYTTTVTVYQVIRRIKDEEIDLSPEWQRNEGIWGDVQKSRLIESLLLRIPIPVFYVAADNNENWAVVDGVQRISTIKAFVNNRFKLKSLEYLKQLDGLNFDEIPRHMQRRIDETQLTVNVVDSDTPYEVMFNIFKRINTGGLPLNGQEIRHALNPGKARDLLTELASTQEFKSATSGTIDTKRMADRECVLRFLAFFINGWSNYTGTNLDKFLGDTMRNINQMDHQDCENLKSSFIFAMNAAEKIFAQHAFRRIKSENSPKSPISKPLFEVWGVCLASQSSDTIKILVENKDEVQRAFQNLLNDDEEFLSAISYSTGLAHRVKKRFETIEDLIQEIIEKRLVE